MHKLAWIVGSLMVLAPLSAQAQSPDAPLLSEQNNVLYAHSNDDDSAQWMNTVPVEGGGTSTGPCDSAVGAGTATCQPAVVDVVFEMMPGLDRPVGLDLTGSAVATVYYGGGFASFGDHDVSMTLMQGDTVILVGEAQNHIYTPKPPSGNVPALDPYDEITWTMTPLVDRLEPGVPLVWTIHGEGTGNNPYVSTSTARGQTNLALPIINIPFEIEGPTTPDAGLVVEETLAAGNATLRIDANQTTADYQFAWANAFPNLNVTASLSGSGEVSYSVVDEANQTVLSGMLAATGAQDHVVSNATTGNWTVHVQLANVTGVFEMSLFQSYVAMVPDESVLLPPPDDEKDASLAVWVAVPALLGAAIMRRKTH